MSSPADVTPLRVGRYAMYQLIGAGGMATVHLGRLVGPAGFGRTVAIKRLRPHLLVDTDAVRAFVDEARIVTRIRHPNVVPTIDIVATDAEVFLVMEYLDGESLAALSSRCGSSGERVPHAIVTAVLSDALRGLHAAHEAVSESGDPLNIVHRDVSPHNILVGSDGIARVLDFGVAKALGRQQSTRDGRIKGKLGYMAPEQLSGSGVTRRTDVFAMGTVLWELLVGRRLFRGDSEGETITRVLMAPVPPPSTVNPEVPAALDALVLRALDRDPTRRFPSAEDMAVALEGAVPAATTRVVAEWVCRVAADKLEARAKQVREIEAHSAAAASSLEEALAAYEPTGRHDGPEVLGASSGDTGHTTPRATASKTEAHPAGRARRAAFFSAGAVTLGIVLVASLWAARGRGTVAPPPATAISTAPPAESPPTASATAPAPAFPPAPDAAVPSSSSSAMAPRPAPRGSTTPVARPGPRASTAPTPASVPSQKPAGSREQLYSRD